MLDYHIHLWPHPELADETDLAVERLAVYCEKAADAGVTEIALTEHFHRFRQARAVVDGFWHDEPDEGLRNYMSDYFDHHATADLDMYVETVIAAKKAGLPIVAGLEVDYYAGGVMSKVADLLDGYPFDVLLGSIHWMGTFMFDVLESDLQMNEWTKRGVDETWREYADVITELAETRSCDVLAHPDLVKVTGLVPDQGLVTEVETRIAEAAAATGMAAEISSAGYRKTVGEAYPSMSLLNRFAALGVPVTTASDTHGTSHVADRVLDLRELAVRAGYTTLCAFRGRTQLEVPIGVALEVPGPIEEPDGSDAKGY